MCCGCLEVYMIVGKIDDEVFVARDGWNGDDVRVGDVDLRMNW